MKLTSLPPEGIHILFSALMGVIVLILLFGCSTPTLTTLDSCDSKFGIDKEECIERVETRQQQYSNRRNFFIGIGK